MDKHARRKLIIASILCLVFMCLEVVGGVMSNSLAIATDAAHLLTDFASFMISLFAIWFAGRPSTRKYVPYNMPCCKGPHFPPNSHIGNHVMCLIILMCHLLETFTGCHLDGIVQRCSVRLCQF